MLACSFMVFEMYRKWTEVNEHFELIAKCVRRRHLYVQSARAYATYRRVYSVHITTHAGYTHTNSK